MNVAAPQMFITDAWDLKTKRVATTAFSLETIYTLKWTNDIVSFVGSFVPAQEWKYIDSFAGYQTVTLL